MQITITKGTQRNQFVCQRPDGTSTWRDLGPAFPYHDLAHFVTETTLQLHHGFYGSIAQGRTINELSDPEVIRTLGPESWLAEILTRNLQALGSGACSEAEYANLVRWEAENMGISPVPSIPMETVELMLSQYRKLCQDWEALLENEAMVLQYVRPV